MSNRIVDADIVKGVDTQIMQEQASAPATPGSGDFKLYVKSDGNLYGKNDGGNEFNLTSQSGSGGKNYLTEYTASLGAGAVNPGNGDFEKNSVAGWSLFNTTLTSLVPTGSITAGAASISTFGPSSTNVLQKKYSLYIDSVAAITAGHGFISDAFYIDRQDQAKIMQIGFTYKVLTGSSNINMAKTSANTFHVYMYDVTGSAWIQPVGVYNMDGSGKFIGSFQTTAAGAQYRIAVIACNASGGAASIQFDDFTCGPLVSSQSAGPSIMSASRATAQAVADATTATLIFPTVGLDSAGAYNSGTGEYTAKEAGTYFVSAAWLFDLATYADSAQARLAVYKNGVEQKVLYRMQGAGTSVYKNLTGNASVQCVAGDILTVRLTNGTGSSRSNITDATYNYMEISKVADASQSFAGAVVSSKLTGSSSTISNAGHSTITFTTVEYDKTASVSSNNTITIPVAGTYSVEGEFKVSVTGGGGSGQNISAYIYKNGAAIGSGYVASIGAGTFSYNPKVINRYDFKAGDTIQLKGDQQAAAGSFAVSDATLIVTKLNTDSTVPVSANVLSQGTMSTFLSSGSFTVPETATTQTKFEITTCGGGGNGGTSTSGNAASGGGAGGCAVKVLSGLTPGQVLTVTVGGATQASSVSGSGFTTIQGNAGADGASGSGSNGNAGGVGGTASGGDLNHQGGDGGSNKGVSAGTIFISGEGGASIFGGGGYAGGTGVGTGAAGKALGSGGGGGANGGSGGVGKQGVVIIKQLTP